MEDYLTFSTLEASRPGRWGQYSLWFKLSDGRKLEVVTTLGDLLRLNGFITRSSGIREPGG